jgi:anti-sigma regulatory factor (Ser/Thr protein kinase)
MMPPITADIHDLIRAMPHGAHLELGALTSAVPTVRWWGRAVMSGWDLAPLADDASAVLTEMTSNSVRHAQGASVSVWLRSDRRQLALMVGDSSPAVPVPASALSTDEAGRGLMIVNALAGRWGAYRTPAGKVTWALLAP